MEGFNAGHRRHSMEYFPVSETAAFLKVCGFCRRGLGPGRDTFIYMCVSVVSPCNSMIFVVSLLENIRSPYLCAS
jgi:hypothetical protein